MTQTVSASVNNHHVFHVVITYGDKTSFDFDVILKGEEYEWRAELCMITRGTLITSNAKTAHACDEAGTVIVSYTR